MSALTRLKEKIEQWKRNHEALKVENATLQGKLDEVVSPEALLEELSTLKELCEVKEQRVNSLIEELKDKDDEIEKIIAQVESLLS